MPESRGSRDYAHLPGGLKAGSIRIGVTGHRFLRDEAMLVPGLAEALLRVEEVFAARVLTVVSPLAEGADRLVARHVLGCPEASLLAVLPLPRQDYLDDFVTPGSRAEFLRLLALADEVVVMPPAPSRDEAYEAAGLYVVRHCEALVAVWDGLASRGRGGTADIVAEAARAGKTICHLWAGNHSPNTVKHTDVGPRYGRVRYLNFPGQPRSTWAGEVGANGEGEPV